MLMDAVVYCIRAIAQVLCQKSTSADRFDKLSTNDVGTRFLPDDYVIGEKSGPYVICRPLLVFVWRM